MARARTIKHEFLRSHSMRRVSRDAQLTFIKLWLMADDAGRLRESVHGLGGLLFPGDDEARRRGRNGSPSSSASTASSVTSSTA